MEEQLASAQKDLESPEYKHINRRYVKQLIMFKVRQLRLILADNF